MEPCRIRIDDHLELRPRQPEDADELFALTDPNRAHLREWLPWLDFCTTVEHTRKNIEESLKQAEQGSSLQVCIWHEGRIVGVTGFNELVPAHRIGQIGYWLGRDHQGKGIMLASVRALVDYGFRELGLNRQVISAAVGNTRSRVIPERLGFRLEGVSREAEWLYDHYVDLVRYGITHGDWQAQHDLKTASISTTGGSLRPMVAGDITSVLALWQQSEGVSLSPGDEPESIVGILARNPGLSSVALSPDGGIAGAVVVGHDARRGYLYHLAVHPAHRGLGLGRALVERSMAGLRAAGIRRCTIVVLGNNEKGAEFWKHFGWSLREDLRVMQTVP